MVNHVSTVRCEIDYELTTGDGRVIASMVWEQHRHLDPRHAQWMANYARGCLIGLIADRQAAS